MNHIKQFPDFLNKNRIVSHFIFWSVFYLLDVFQYSISTDYDLKNALLYNFSALIPQILFSYYVGYFIILKFFVKKQYIVSILLFVIGTYFFSVCNRLMIHLTEYVMGFPLDKQESFLEVLTDFKFLISRYIPSNFFVAFIFVSIKYVTGYQKIQNQDLEINNEKIESELKQLKAQLNPHFLFNTLNNIYSLSIINSPKTSISISKLSDILDYILYRCNTKFVFLSNEIQLLKNYIELEKLRYDDRLEVIFTTQIENDTEIPPLILLSLVENAFKHGAGEDSGSPKIHIEVVNTQDNLMFKVLNTISKEYTSFKKEKIGLTNIKKQLDLIYKNHYNLSIHSNDSTFTVTLKIKNQRL